ncbi:hypothetical protein HPP92_015425 [Vanilla planifolia]|uniref:Translation initiation factor 5A-like N-terminal domain-containing protein n=1 Tax=Vanilla planifolia TaxID=51239 RepID=A0A835QTD2_VANPL|nr:hypothetical protein HPP92_015425 [Vanilla planifolia]
MSDEEHHFESKADAGASKTYPQQAGSIRKNGYVVIKGRPCKVFLYGVRLQWFVEIARWLKCQLLRLGSMAMQVALDIFNNKKLEDVVPSSHNVISLMSTVLTINSLMSPQMVL